MRDNFHLQFISTKDTLALRHRVLKPHLTIENCRLDEDDLATTFHYGLFLKTELIVIATMIREEHPNFKVQTPYRLRGMATDKNFQNQGFGKKLLSTAIENLEERGCDFLWFNARQIAFPFYQSLGFQFHGPPFEIENIGLHKVMYKPLIPR
jgi:GNAT superfamily N-acetyltransferase